jgi:hypothetical protein
VAKRQPHGEVDHRELHSKDDDKRKDLDDADTEHGHAPEPSRNSSISVSRQVCLYSPWRGRYTFDDLDWMAIGTALPDTEAPLITCQMRARLNGDQRGLAGTHSGSTSAELHARLPAQTGQITSRFPSCFGGRPRVAHAIHQLSQSRTRLRGFEFGRGSYNPDGPCSGVDVLAFQRRQLTPPQAREGTRFKLMGRSGPRWSSWCNVSVRGTSRVLTPI